MLEFAWPVAFALLVVPFFVRWLVPAAERQERALVVPQVWLFRFDGAGAGLLGKPAAWFGTLALFLCWGLLTAALARPQFVGEPTEIPTSGRDLMLAIDVSGSMGTEDMKMGNRRFTRLDTVKAVGAQFIEDRTGDRVGLIVFGTRPYLYVPLTFDLRTVGEMLSTLESRVAGGRTTIGNTIGLAITHLKERPDGDRVLILLTDGAHNQGELSPRQAAELAASFGVRIHTIGVGKTVKGFYSSSSLDEPTLKEISAITGGEYFEASDSEVLQQVYAEISQLEPVEQDPEVYRPVQSLIHWPLGLAIVLFLAVLSISSRSHA